MSNLILVNYNASVPSNEQQPSVLSHEYLENCDWIELFNKREYALPFKADTMNISELIVKKWVQSDLSFSKFLSEAQSIFKHYPQITYFENKTDLEIAYAFLKQLSDKSFSKRFIGVCLSHHHHAQTHFNVRPSEVFDFLFSLSLPDQLYSFSEIHKRGNGYIEYEAESLTHFLSVCFKKAPFEYFLNLAEIQSFEHSKGDFLAPSVLDDIFRHSESSNAYPLESLTQYYELTHTVKIVCSLIGEEYEGYFDAYATIEPAITANAKILEPTSETLKLVILDAIDSSLKLKVKHVSAVPLNFGVTYWPVELHRDYAFLERICDHIQSAPTRLGEDYQNAHHMWQGLKSLAIRDEQVRSLILRKFKFQACSLLDSSELTEDFLHNIKQFVNKDAPVEDTVFKYVKRTEFRITQSNVGEDIWNLYIASPDWLLDTNYPIDRFRASTLHIASHLELSASVLAEYCEYKESSSIKCDFAGYAARAFLSLMSSPTNKSFLESYHKALDGFEPWQQLSLFDLFVKQRLCLADPEKALQAAINDVKSVKGWHDAIRYTGFEVFLNAFLHKKSNKKITKDSVTKKQYPKLVEVLKKHFKGFSFKTYEAICKWASIAPYTYKTNGESQGHAASLTVLFGSDEAGIIGLLNKQKGRKSFKSTLAEFGSDLSFPSKQEEWDRHFWKNFVLQFPQALPFGRFFARVKPEDLLTLTYKKFIEKVSILHYSRGSENPAMAILCFKYGHSEGYFNTLLDRYSPKKHSEVPNIRFEENGYTFRLLEPGDPRALLIGLESGCCQHIDGYGRECAKHSYVSPYSGVFVIEKEGQLVAQSWAWLGNADYLKEDPFKVKSCIVFDSIEGLRKDKESLHVIASLFDKAAVELKTTYNLRSFVSKTAYGMTREVRSHLKQIILADCPDNLKKQAFVLRQCPVMSSRCDYSDADEGVYELRSYLTKKVDSVATEESKPHSELTQESKPSSSTPNTASTVVIARGDLQSPDIWTRFQTVSNHY